jgi:hypothetical protein
MENKPGKLSKQDLAYIKENLDKTPEQIAAHLKRNVETVKNYIQKTHLELFRSESDDDVSIIARLIGRSDWPSIQRQFNKEELETFKSMWVDFFKQFSMDVLATEQLQMLNVIKLELLMNRNLEERNKASQRLAELEQESLDLRKRLENETNPLEKEKLGREIEINEMRISEARGSTTSRTAEYEKFQTKAAQIYKDLKSTRDQRADELRDTKTTFVDWLKQINDHRKMEREARELALRKEALVRAKEKLADYHQYMDGMVDQPLLTPETVK